MDWVRIEPVTPRLWASEFTTTPASLDRRDARNSATYLNRYLWHGHGPARPPCVYNVRSTFALHGTSMPVGGAGLRSLSP